ncbi:MAG: class I SAM-dependent methyltransferase, partial [Candidatus Zixiibacteriota bacterium]
FCALSPVQRKSVMDKFHLILKPGGAVLLDVYSLMAFNQRQDKAIYKADLLDGFWSPNKYYGFLNTFKYDDVKVVLDKYTIVEAKRVRTIYNWLQYFSPESLENEFTESGFIIEKLFADVAGSPFDPKSDEFAAIARRR